MRSIAIISSQAFSLVNFRGSLIRSMTERQIKVYAIAPDFDDVMREGVAALGAEPVDCSLSRGGMNPLTDVGDAALIVGDTGWIVPARAPKALAAGIESAMASIATHGKSSLGRQSRARIEAHYSVKTMADAYTALWNRVIS